MSLADGMHVLVIIIIAITVGVKYREVAAFLLKGQVQCVNIIKYENHDRQGQFGSPKNA
jgi:hypothetical protein